MPNPIIEGMRQELLDTTYYKQVVKNQNIKKFKEEFNMSNAFPGGFPPVPGGLTPPAGMATPQAPQAPVSGGSNINRLRQDAVASALRKGAQIRPLGLVTDGMEIHRYVFDEDNTELQAFIADWKEQNKKVNKVTGLPEPKSINAIRAVKELCAQNGKEPANYAKYDDAGKPVLELKKPSVKGLILKYPATETSGSYIDIVKKANLADAIIRAGGFQLAGTIEESQLNKDELDIPLAIALIPSKRKSSDATGRVETKPILRIVGRISDSLKKALFPGKNTVGMYDMFNIYPHGEYKFNRVVPLKLYKTQIVDGKEVGVLDLDPEKKLPQYESYENPLTASEFGKDLMEAINKSASELQATFTRKAGGDVTETQVDLIESLLSIYTGAESDPTVVDTYVNRLL